jgi:sulfur-oxidizing protein SoxY
MGLSLRPRHAASAIVVALWALAVAGPARAEETAASRAARWHDVSAAVFNGRPVKDDTGLLQLDAPVRALDAALVPVTITVRPDVKIVGLTLVIDDNPAPVAARFHFGALADPHVIKTRVRVDQYTLLHAVAELPDGTLVSTSRFIKAAGGCSAPGSTNLTEAMARLGRMKLRLLGPAGEGALSAELLISHPNINGMQMDPVTRFYTQARYVQTVKVTQAGATVFTMDGDISLAEDPSITFGFRPLNSAAPLDVEVDDSAKAVFRQSFPMTGRAS